VSPIEGDAKPLSKESQLARGERRYTRKVASQRRWQQIIAAKGGPCRVCGASVVQFHHLIPRSQGGSDTEANIVPLCADCHRRIEARDKDAGMALALALTDAEYAYMVEHGGEDVLERRLGIVYTRP
jgi:5-methylcytosine-specific restriction endonuclease McrA